MTEPVREHVNGNPQCTQCTNMNVSTVNVTMGAGTIGYYCDRCDTFYPTRKMTVSNKYT